MYGSMSMLVAAIRPACRQVEGLPKAGSLPTAQPIYCHLQVEADGLKAYGLWRSSDYTLDGYRYRLLPAAIDSTPKACATCCRRPQ